jgi:hypothetical protein
VLKREAQEPRLRPIYRHMIFALLMTVASTFVSGMTYLGVMQDREHDRLDNEVWYSQVSIFVDEVWTANAEEYLRTHPVKFGGFATYTGSVYIGTISNNATVYRNLDVVNGSAADIESGRRTMIDGKLVISGRCETITFDPDVSARNPGKQVSWVPTHAKGCE